MAKTVTKVCQGSNFEELVRRIACLPGVQGKMDPAGLFHNRNVGEHGFLQKGKLTHV